MKIYLRGGPRDGVESDTVLADHELPERIPQVARGMGLIHYVRTDELRAGARVYQLEEKSA